MKFFRHGYAAAARLATAGLLAFAASTAQAQVTLAQFWAFDDPAGTLLPSVAPGFEGGARWTAALAGVAADGAGQLRLGYNATALGYSYAPLNINEGGVFYAKVVYSSWDLKNGADSGNTRPSWNFGLRSAASTSSSLVADVQLTALATGIDVLVRDAQSDFTAQRFTLPATLTSPLTLELKLDRVATPKVWTLNWSTADNSISGNRSGTLGNTAVARNPSHVFFGIRGNHPNGALNVAPLVDRVEVAFEEQIVTLLPPQDGRPGKPSNLVTYLSGNPVQSPQPPVGGPGLLLMGGGPEVDAAFTQRAYPVVNAGDIVVLRVSGADGYQNYLYNDLVNQLPPKLRPLLQPNSVMTLMVDTRSKANSDFVFDAVSKANLVWMAGGDQSQYISHWKGTALASAVQMAYKRGAVVGGTSAGMVVSGEWMYDPGALTAVTSVEAVANPYRPSVIISTDLFGLNLGFNLVPETHFANRDRMGRLLTFMARLRQDARTSLVYGIGLDEQTSMFIDAAGIGTFQRQAAAGNGYVLREDRRGTQRVQVVPDLPLIYRNVQRHKFTTPGQTFDFNRGTTAVPATPVSVEGALPVNPY